MTRPPLINEEFAAINKLDSRAHDATDSGKSFQERRGIHQVGRRPAFGVGGINGAQDLVRFGAATLLLPEPREAHRGASAPIPCFPGAAHFLDGLLEAVLGGARVLGRFSQDQVASLPKQLGLAAALVILLGDGHALVKRPAGVLISAGLYVCVDQDAQLECKGQFGAPGAEGTVAFEQQRQRSVEIALQ